MSKFDEIKDALPLKAYADAHLEPARERNNYICPKCHSGKGENKTAAFFIYGTNLDKFKCQSCGISGDIFDLIGIKENLPGKAEQLKRAAEIANINLEGERPQSPKQSAPIVKDFSKGIEAEKLYLARCKDTLKNKPTEQAVNYLEQRGYLLEEAVELGIGLDPNHPQGWKDSCGNWHSGQRLILPWKGSAHYHIDRAIDPDKLPAATTKYAKPKTEKVGKQPLYNPDFYKQEYVYVVEGVLDALPLELAGYNVVALGGISTRDFIDAVAAHKYAGVVIDFLDADETGRKTAHTIADALESTQAAFYPAEEYGLTAPNGYGGENGGYKDAGEWFATNRDELPLMLETARALALDRLNQQKAEKYRGALQRLNVTQPIEIARTLLDVNTLAEPIPTGLENLDAALNGGLRPGELTFLGAISSYGKTTLITQIADHIAQSGYPVLFVTLEQSAQEIIAKSISRLIYQTNSGGYNAISPGEITDRTRRSRWNQGYNSALQEAVENYARLIAPNLQILEGVEQPKVSHIQTIVGTIAEHTGRAPFVFIDYLQLLAPPDEWSSDKRTIDTNVSELRKLARDSKTHIVCVSSLNRSSYSGAISLDSFKESGAIEYGADNLIGLQPYGIADKLESMNQDAARKAAADKTYKESKAQRTNEREITVLKHRSGALPKEPIPLTFHAESALFTCGAEELNKPKRKAI